MLERSDSDASDPGNEGSASVQRREITAGAALFARLRTLGVDYVFCNSGTDFPPIIEGLAEASAGDVALPEPLVRQLVERAAGNPLFLAELLHAVMQRLGIGDWRLGIVALSIPRTRSPSLI